MAAALPARAVGAWMWGVALAVWAGGLCWLSWVDWRHLIVPAGLVRATAAASGLLVLGASALRHNWHFVEAGTACAAGVGAVLATWSLLRPGQLGFGDVRAGALVAFGAGAVSPAACLAAVPAACLLAGLGGRLLHVLSTGAARGPGASAQVSPSVPASSPALWPSAPALWPSAPLSRGAWTTAAAPAGPQPACPHVRSRFSAGGQAVALVPFLALGGIIVVVASAA